MAIKVGGTTVIDDNRCLCNIQDACITGTLTAGTIVGDGSQLTGVGGGGPSAQPVYMTLSSSSAAVSKGEPVAHESFCCLCSEFNCVVALAGDPSVCCDATITTTPYDRTAGSACFQCYADVASCPAYYRGHHCYTCCKCCMDARGFAMPLSGGYTNTFRIAQDKYVKIEIGGGVGYCCKECFTTVKYGQACDACIGCVTSLAGEPAVGSFQIPCFCITEYKLDSTNNVICKNKTAKLTASANWSCTDQQCYNFASGCVKLNEALLGFPMGVAVEYECNCQRCCCTLCCSGNKQRRYIQLQSGSGQLSYTGCFAGTFISSKCCCDGTCSYEVANNICHTPLPFMKGPASNYTMNLISCTDNKYYSLFLVSSGRCQDCANCNCSFSGSYLNRSLYSPMSLGLMSFCMCTGGTEMDTSTLCMNYDLNGDWRMGYVSKNKRFMFGEHSRVNAVACGQYCHCNRGCGFIYVNEINDSFVPKPVCGCIASTNRLMEFGYAQTSGVTTNTEQEWRFWPTGETCDGWVIATQPVETLCYFSWTTYQNKMVQRVGSYLKMFAIKPIATGSACMTNVVCLCHNYKTDGGICWGNYNGETDTCTGNFFGLCYLACDPVDTTTKGAHLVFDHDDRVHTSFYNELYSQLDYSYRLYAKYQYACSCASICGGQVTDYQYCGMLPATNLHRVTSAADSNTVNLCFANYWFVGNSSDGYYSDGARGYITCDCTVGSPGGCSYSTVFMGGEASAVLCIDNATNCLTINSCSGFTQFCCTRYCCWNNANAFGGFCIINERTHFICRNVSCDPQFEDVNILRGQMAFGNGNACRFSTCDMTSCNSWNTCCDFYGGFGSWCAVNNCFGNFCGCNVCCLEACEATACAANRPMIHGPSLIDPLAFTWVTQPSFDQGRFTEDFVYNQISCGVVTDYCNVNDCYYQQTWGQGPISCTSCPHKNRIDGGFINFACCLNSICRRYFVSPYKEPSFKPQVSTCFSSGFVKFCNCVDGDAVCCVFSEDLAGTMTCPTEFYEFGSKILVGSPESDNIFTCDTAGVDTYRYYSVTKPNQNNKPYFVGWALEDTNPGSKVPIMTVDRGFLPIDASTQGWCDIDLSKATGNCTNYMRACRQIISGNSGSATCITDYIYATYDGPCCLCCSPFRTCTCGAGNCNYQLPVICFAIDADCCCCAYVTTLKTIG